MFSLIELKDEPNKHIVAKVQTMDLKKKKVISSLIWFYPDMDNDNGVKGFFNRLDFDNSIVSLVPRKDTREIFYVCGKSGVGKSTWMANVALNYHLLHPKSKVYVISTVNDDDAFDKYDWIDRINIKDIVEEPIEDVNELKNSLVIMDDMETASKEDLIELNRLRDKIMTTGRHSNTSLGVLYHHLFDGQKSRLMISENSVCVFYPASNAYQPAKFMKTYCGMSPKQIKNVSAIKSRWIAYVNSYFKPFIIYEHGIAMIDALDNI